MYTETTSKQVNIVNITGAPASTDAASPTKDVKMPNFPKPTSTASSSLISKLPDVVTHLKTKLFYSPIIAKRGKTPAIERRTTSPGTAKPGKPQTEFNLKNHYPPNYNRRAYDYQTNLTPARQVSSELPIGTSLTEISLWGSTPTKQVRVLRDAIADDTQRRIQLFYLQCVTVWKTNAAVNRKTTTEQHGFTDIKGCSAAHSALFPHLQDDYAVKFFKDPSEGDLRVLKCMGVDTSVDKGKTFTAKKTTKNSKTQEIPKNLVASARSLLNDLTHLHHAANATIEMPKYVNDYHTLFETSLRKTGEALLNQCSKGDLHPRECTDTLTQSLQKFLDDSLQQTIIKIDYICQLRKQIGRLQRAKITLLDKKIDKTAFILNCKNIITEIDDLKNKIETTRHFSLPVDVSEIVDCVEHLNKSLSIGCQTTDANQPRLSRLRGQQSSGPEKPVSIEERTGMVFTALENYFFYHSLYFPSFDAGAKALNESGPLIYILQENSISPAYEMLSGKKENGGRKPYNDKELYEQKFEIIPPLYKINHSSARKIGRNKSCSDIGLEPFDVNAFRNSLHEGRPRPSLATRSVKQKAGRQDKKFIEKDKEKKCNSSTSRRNRGR